MRNRKKTTATLESYKRTLSDLRNVFLNVTIGDYSNEVVFPEEDEEDSQSEIYYGVKLMYDTIREKIEEIENLKKKYEKKNGYAAELPKKEEKVAEQSTWKWYADGDFFIFSEKSSEIFELPVTENTKLNFEDFLSFMDPDDQAKFLQVWKKTKAGKNNFFEILHILTKSDKRKKIIMLGTIQTDTKNNIISIEGTFQDVIDYVIFINRAEENPEDIGIDILSQPSNGKNANNQLISHSDEQITEFPESSEGTAAHQTVYSGIGSGQAKNESNYRMILDSLNTAIILVNKNGVIELVNEYFQKLFGFEPKAVTGTLLNSILINLPDSDLKQFKTSKFLARKEKMELRLKKKDGTLFWAQINKIPLKERHESIFMINDIDKIKKYENKINAAADFSMENPNPLLRFSITQQRFISSNRAAKHLMRYFHSEKNIRLFEELRKKINRFYETKKIEQEEIKVNKQTFLFTFVSARNKKYVNIYGNELTAIKKAESEIRRLLFILSKTDNSVIVADKNGLIQWVNDGFERLCGYKLSEVKGTSGAVLRKGKSTGLDPGNTYFNRMMKTKQSVSYESKNFKKDGTEYWAFTTFTPVLDADGEIDCIVAVDSDITMKKRVEKQMLLAMKLSAESAKAKQNFLANMSHEIRTPMNGIMGIIQLLQDTNLDDKQKEYLKSMAFAGENLLSIVNDVLDLSKIESGKMKAEKMVFDPKSLIQELIKSMAHRVNEKFLKLTVNIDENIPPALIGDPLRLNQILINLLSNSIKFTDEGEISIIMGFESTDHGGFLKMTVKDTGIGIPKEKQQIIFDEFEQAHTGNKKLYGGTGLGLSIVKKLVEILEGKMTFYSAVGVGTEFTIIIPVEISANNKTEFKEPVDADNADKMIIYKKKLLLVEDNKLNQMVAERFLTKMGAEVVTAENGLEAIRILKEQNFDAVLMDIQMPEMNGYETTRYIREKFEKSKCDIPILAMTAHALDGEEKKCIDAGMDDYISKPLMRETLEKMLINLFKRYGNQIRQP